MILLLQLVRFNLRTLAFNLSNRAFSLPTRAFNLATHTFSVLIREFELITRKRLRLQQLIYYYLQKVMQSIKKIRFIVLQNH